MTNHEKVQEITSLHGLSDHDYVPAVLFPYHSPEIVFRSWKWTLGRNVLTLPVVVALQNHVISCFCDVTKLSRTERNDLMQKR